MKQQKKEEEAKILAQMDEAMREKETQNPENAPKRVGLVKDKTPATVHCHKCGTLMEEGKCPNCGHTIYTPMDEKTQKTIRWIFGGICLVVLLVIVLMK